MHVGLFSNVDQAEVEAKGSHHVDQSICIQPLNEFCQFAAFGTDFTFAQADIALTKDHDRLQYLAPGLRLQNLSKDIAEQFYSGP